MTIVLKRFDATQRKYITALRPNSTAVLDQKAVAIAFRIVATSSPTYKIATTLMDWPSDRSSHLVETN